MMNTVEKLEKSVDHLAVSDIVPLLDAEGPLQQKLFERARQVRHEAGQDAVFLRGVIEISNHCSKNCDYCAMRSANKDFERYSLNADEIISLAKTVKETGIKTIFFQGGQHPESDPVLETVIPVMRKDLGLDVLLCLGERSKEVYKRFVELGATSYILKYETSDPALFKKVKHGDLEKRMQCIEWIREAGMKIGTGNITGLPGQSVESLANDIITDVRLHPDFVSTSPFIPNSNTPLESAPKGSAAHTLNTIAILRILLKTPLIPSVSALESVATSGQTAGLNAGANVLTINFTPKTKRELYKIYSKGRFVVSLDHARKSIEQAGLHIRN